ncbi:hypothetical protein [Luteibacter sp. CQ10]|uniref:hypothetical protein n=1 Tax=Luteibacter sp. CQ10 TaxID=2805821 RepID=UPI0034A2B4D9
MSEESVRRELAGPLYGQEPWPIRFHTHAFGFRCYNTLSCSGVYNRYQFGTRKWIRGIAHDRPKGPPPVANWRDDWTAGHAVLAKDGKTFPGPLEIEWTSLDGEEHATSIDFDVLFKDRRVLHAVAREDIKERWLETLSTEPVSPDILVEVNDRTVGVFMRALLVIETGDAPELRSRRFRDDIVLAKSVTF